MKKQWILVALAFAFAFASCTKTDPVGPDPVDPAVVDPETDTDTTPQAMQFGTNLSFVETKAGVDGWNGQDLYVYGFEAAADGAFNYSTAYIDNVKAQAPAAPTTPGADPTMTGAINVYNAAAKDINGHEIANTKYYYRDGIPSGASNGVRDFLYNFYGYYVANAAGTTPTPTKSATDVKLDITIDGTQDVMLATTNKDNDVIGKFKKDGTTPLTTERLYSAYSARRGVVPNLVFKHQLSRFVFNIKAGNDKGKLVMVESINVASLVNGTLTIAPTQELAVTGTFPTDTVGLSLKDANGDPLPALTGTYGSYAMPATAIVPSINPAPQTPDAFVRVGESVMVMPGQAKYPLRLEIIQFKLPSPTAENIAENRTPLQRFKQTYEIDLSQTVYNTTDTDWNNAWKGKAAPGYQYNIDLTIYGPEEIVINVTLTPWTEYGTHIGIDPDKD